MINKPWAVIVSPTDPEMYAVRGVYLVADKLSIEDACLIAEAPKLLEALEALVARHRAFCTSPDWNGPDWNGKDDVEQALAQAAILKARGGYNDRD
jgi:hypothetical protein